MMSRFKKGDVVNVVFKGVVEFIDILTGDPVVNTYDISKRKAVACRRFSDSELELVGKATKPMRAPAGNEL